MNKNLNIAALVGAVLIFAASFLASATNSGLFISAINAGGIWYLLPAAGLAGIVLASLAITGKIEMKVYAFIVGGIALVLSTWFAIHGQASLEQFVLMQSEISKGFDSSFFTGKQADTSNLPKSSFGIAFYMDLVGSILLIVSGALSKKTAE